MQVSRSYFQPSRLLWSGLCASVLVFAGCSSDDDSSGAAGASGASGSAGAAGVSGSAGSAGSSGASGAAGAAGASGAGGTAGQTSGTENGYSRAFASDSVAFDCAETLDAVLAKNPPHLTSGPTTIVVGYEQIGSSDQDPIVARWDNGTQTFCEHSKKGGGVDGRAYGLTWDGANNLYVVYTIVGGGTLFDAAASGGWVSSYGDGGASAKVTVIGKVDTQFGVVQKATFVPSRLVKNGQTKTNTHIPADALHALADGSFEFLGTPAYCTLNPDQSSMCDPAAQDYPKNYRARFSADLSTMSCASAEGVSLVKTPCP